MKKVITSLAGTYLNALSHVSPGLAASTGLKLFCRPFRAKMKDYHHQFFNTADRFSFEYDGIEIQGYRWGEGEKKILFLHGWQSHTFRWRNYIEALPKDQYTIYSIDAPGHGLSAGSFLTVPYYSGVIRQLIETIGHVHAVVGHSLGSFSMLHALYEQPALPVNRLILTAPPGEASDFVAVYQGMLQLSEKTMTLILKHFEEKFGKPISWFSTSKFAHAVSLPGLIIHDEEDEEAPFHYSKKINEQWPQSRLIATKGLGHNLKSKNVIDEIVKFINAENPIPVMEISGDVR